MDLLEKGAIHFEEETEVLKQKVYEQAKQAFRQQPFQTYASGKPARQFHVSGDKKLDYTVGDRVRHIKFGEGIVKEIIEGGRDYEVTVDFDAAGIKKMFASFAKLQKV